MKSVFLKNCGGWSFVLMAWMRIGWADTDRLVWLEFDQSGLDAAYDQSVYAPNLEQVLARYTSNSELARDVLGQPSRFKYGEHPDEAMDVFKTDSLDAPIHVFVHGGAWKYGSAAQNSFLAESFVRSGAHFVALDFSSVEDFNGDLRPMVDQLRRAFVWIYGNARTEFGGDPDQIYISGFSSGGHLAAVLVTTDWTHYEGIPADLIKGALLCSGMYDLFPVSLSYRRDYVDFTPEVIETFSPIAHIGLIKCPVLIAYGTFETPEFQRQAVEFSDALKQASKPVTVLVGAGYNHFEIIETLANPYGVLGRAALEQMKLVP